jgi:hypothetical protein
LPIEFHFSVFIFFLLCLIPAGDGKKPIEPSKILKSIYTTDSPIAKIGFASNSLCFIRYEAFGVSLTLDPCVADSADLYP